MPTCLRACLPCVCRALEAGVPELQAALAAHLPQVQAHAEALAHLVQRAGSGREDEEVEPDVPGPVPGLDTQLLGACYEELRGMHAQCMSGGPWAALVHADGVPQVHLLAQLQSSLAKHRQLSYIGEQALTWLQSASGVGANAGAVGATQLKAATNMACSTLATFGVALRD